jgi:hypothetical protein
MKGSVSMALSADILSMDYRTVLEGQKQARERRNGGLKRVRTEGGPITVGTGRKIDERLVQEAKDVKQKREWERISASLFETYQTNKSTVEELREQLPAAMTQAKTRKVRFDKGKKKVRPSDQAEQNKEVSKANWVRWNCRSR